MSQLLTLDEFALRDKARCGLSENPLSTGDWDVLPVLAEVLLGASRKWPDPREVAGRVIHYNRQICGYQFARSGCIRQDTGSAKACFIGARLAQVAQEFRVVQPIEPYTLDIGGSRITGEYAVLRKPKRDERCVLYLRGAETEHQPVKPLKKFWPDLVSYARLVHFADTHPGQKVSVLNWHFSSVLQWRDHIHIDFARRCLENAGRVIEQGRAFPSPGYHCRGCSQPQCCAKSVRPRRKQKTANEIATEKLERIKAIAARMDFPPLAERAQ